MRNKLLQDIISAVQYTIMLGLFGVCMLGMIGYIDSATRWRLGECAVRLIFLFMFSFYYYSNFSRLSRPDSVFLPLFLLFSAGAEAKILGTTTWGSSLPVSEIHVFSSLGVCATVIGYGLNYRETSFNKANTFLAVSLIGVFIITTFIPKTQNMDDLWNGSILLVLTLMLNAMALAVHIGLITTEPPGSQWVRHFSITALCLSTCLNICFDSMVLNIIGTIVYGITIIVVIALTAKKAIQF